MGSLKARLSARVDRLRERYTWIDHVVRAVQHYGNVNGNAQAGAITYFGFLSFFPILALAFFVVGQVSKVYDAKDQLVEAIDSFLPGIVGNDPGEIPLATFEQNAATIGLLGLAGLLYSGLGWLSGMRDALEVVFGLPKREQPGFVGGKARDLASLAVIGVVLLVSVGLSGALSGFSQQLLELVGLEDTPVTTAVLWLVVHGLGIAATTLLFLVMFKLLVDPGVPRWALLSGAVLGGVGFELLKSLSVFLIGATKDQPAFQAFGITLILLIWINYFSRVVMYSASWAYTSPAALEQRTAEAMRAPGATLTMDPAHEHPVPVTSQEASSAAPPPTAGRPARVLLGGAAVLAGVVAVVVRRSHHA
jgi:membrane protein